MARRRTGLTRWMGDVADNTKDYFDDILDRARDVEHDVRRAARKAVEDRDDGVDYDDIADLEDELADLRRGLRRRGDQEFGYRSRYGTGVRRGRGSPREEYEELREEIASLRRRLDLDDRDSPRRGPKRSGQDRAESDVLREDIADLAQRVEALTKSVEELGESGTAAE